MKSDLILNRVFLAIFLIATWSGIIQGDLSVVKERDLSGDVVLAENTEFDFNSWFSGIYQEEKEAYLNDNFGFRSTCIRIKNEYEYVLYNKLNAREIIMGKDKYMYEESYILSYTGHNSMGGEFIENRIKLLHSLSDTLRKLNKLFIVVIAPGKASYFNEYIPDDMNIRVDSSNYELFAARYNRYADINIIDFRSMFNQMKQTSPHPLFPKFGIHWAPYGVELAADSIFNTIENLDSIKLRRKVPSSYYMEQAHGVDYDIGDGLNLLFEPGDDVIAYPEYNFVEPEGYVMPRLLVISDSFYWNMYDRFKYSFSENEFWYYFKDVNQGFNRNDPTVSLEQVKNKITNSDIIMIMTNESQVQSMGWGFLEAAQSVFGYN